MEMGTSILKRLGYKVTSQTDSVKALEVFRSSPDEFDLVITDYTMPKLTGLDFAREILGFGLIFRSCFAPGLVKNLPLTA